MATYYDLFADQSSHPEVSVPYVDGWGSGWILKSVVTVNNSSNIKSQILGVCVPSNSQSFSNIT